MKSQHIRKTLLSITILVMVISCKSPSPAVHEEARTDTVSVERESLPPDKTALEELDAAIARAENSKQLLMSNDKPPILGDDDPSTIFPRDWDIMDSVFSYLEMLKKTSTIREIQESTARYSAAADAFDALNTRTLVLFLEGNEEELAYARAEAVKYLAWKKEQIEIAAREKERKEREAAELATKDKERQEEDPVWLSAREKELQEKEAAEIAAKEKERQEDILQQQKIKEADAAIAAARSRLDAAASLKAALLFPKEHDLAQKAYAEALSNRLEKKWDAAISAANQVITELVDIDRKPAVAAVKQNPLPARYTVRPWRTSRDSFRVIAGYPWVYNDQSKWRILYNANKSKLPQPNNPDLINIGMIMDIPSIKGEFREGMWNEKLSYPNIKDQ